MKKKKKKETSTMFWNPRNPCRYRTFCCVSGSPRDSDLHVSFGQCCNSRHKATEEHQAGECEGSQPSLHNSLKGPWQAQETRQSPNSSLPLYSQKYQDLILYGLCEYGYISGMIIYLHKKKHKSYYLVCKIGLVCQNVWVIHVKNGRKENHTEYMHQGKILLPSDRFACVFVCILGLFARCFLLCFSLLPR